MSRLPSHCVQCNHGDNLSRGAPTPPSTRTNGLPNAAKSSDTLMCSVSAPVWLPGSLRAFNRWQRPGSDFTGGAREEGTQARTQASTTQHSVAGTSTRPQEACSKTPTKGYTPTATRCTNRGRCSTTEAVIVDGQRSPLRCFLLTGKRWDSLPARTALLEIYFSFLMLNTRY